MEGDVTTRLANKMFVFRSATSCFSEKLIVLDGSVVRIVVVAMGMYMILFVEDSFSSKLTEMEMAATRA